MPLLISFALAVSASPSAPADRWAPLRTLLDGWELHTNYSLMVGGASGSLFKYDAGSFSEDVLIPTGSTTKWPSAMMFAGLVNDGTIPSLDTPVHRFFDWWTSSPFDRRSKVTLRMLLSFTSGFGDGHPGMESNTRAARQWRVANNASRVHGLQATLEQQGYTAAALKCDTTTGDITECARSVYETVKLIGTPGKVYSYNSNHLNIAAAVAVSATGLPIHAVIKKYLLEPYGMRSSFYEGKCPDFGGSLVTNGRDYASFLHGVLTYKVLSKEITDASEVDSTPFMKDYYTLYGDYGFGHFLACFDSVDGFTDACAAKKLHMDPGAFGFIPVIDRELGYYIQLVTAQIYPTGSYPLSGIPEYLAVAIKPHVDAILRKPAERPAAEEHLHYTPEFLTLGVADVNYCLNCKLHPEQCD